MTIEAPLVFYRLPVTCYFLLAALAIRLLCRAAVLGWINPFRPARSSSFMASCRAAAMSVTGSVPRTFLSAVRSSLRWARFRAVCDLVWRICFLADRVLGTAHPRESGTVLGQGGGPLPAKP